MQTVSYEEVLDLIDIGPFQHVMLLACGLGNAADAVEIMAVGLVLPSVGAEMGLTSAQKGLLSSCIFIGMLIGQVMWGLLGDMLGRRVAFMCTMGINGAFALASAASPDFTTLVIMRTLSGVGVGGSVPIVFSHFAEFLPTHRRGFYMVLLASFWMVGSIYSATTGWLVIPLFGWRVYTAVAAAPTLICFAMVALFVPESPRYLLVQSDTEGALKVLRRAARMNGRPLSPELALTPHHPDSIGRREHRSCGKMQEGLSKIRSVVSWPYRMQSIALCLLWFGLSFGWYGTILWMPEYFKSHHSIKLGAPPSPPDSKLDDSDYASTLAVALSNLPGNVVSALLVERVGRRITLGACMALAGAVSLVFSELPPSTPGLGILAACVFNAVSVGGWNTLPLYSAEVYPTTMRATAMGVLGGAGKLGSTFGGFTNGLLSVYDSRYFMYLSTFVLWLGSLAAYASLPMETCGMILTDTAHDSMASSISSKIRKRNLCNDTYLRFDDELDGHLVEVKEVEFLSATENIRKSSMTATNDDEIGVISQSSCSLLGS